MPDLFQWWPTVMSTEWLPTLYTLKLQKSVHHLGLRLSASSLSVLCHSSVHQAPPVRQSEIFKVYTQIHPHVLYRLIFHVKKSHPNSKAGDIVHFWVLQNLFQIHPVHKYTSISYHNYHFCRILIWSSFRDEHMWTIIERTFFGILWYYAHAIQIMDYIRSGVGN